MDCKSTNTEFDVDQIDSNEKLHTVSCNFSKIIIHDTPQSLKSNSITETIFLYNCLLSLLKLLSLHIKISLNILLICLL